MRALMNIVESLRGLASTVSFDLHDATAPIAAMAGVVAARVPSAWFPYGGDRVDGYLSVTITFDGRHRGETDMVSFGLHRVPRPAGWTPTVALGRLHAQRAAGMLVLELAAAEDEADFAPVIAAIERSGADYRPTVGWEQGVFSGEGG